jgi:hypothetical protein
MNELERRSSRRRILVGQIPDPEELYGREELIHHLWRMLEGNNVLLLAPRRFGKSGIMRHVLLKPEPGYLPLSFELEDVDSPEEFVWRVTKELLAHDTTRRLLQGVKKLPAAIMHWVKSTVDEAGFEGAKVKFKAAIREEWGEAAKRMLTELEKADQRMVFLFDELPAMVDGISKKQGDDAARGFLAWFRTIRLAQKDVLRRHRFIVAGSIGIDQILKRLGATDKLVDFARVPVEPLGEDVARELAQSLAKTIDVNWNEALACRLFQLIGAPVPYFIHLFFSLLGQLPLSHRKEIAEPNLERLYAQQLLGPTCRQYFAHYSTRLKRYGESGEKAALAILRAVADQQRVSRPALFDIYRKAYGRGASEQGFDDIVADLECDWYLRLNPDTNEFYFRLKVMRDWWRRWYPASPAKGKLLDSTRL